MDWNRVEGNWKQIKGAVKQQWGKLTDDDLDQIAGQRDKFIGKVQERYGLAQDEAQRRADDWLRTTGDMPMRSTEKERHAHR